MKRLRLKSSVKSSSAKVLWMTAIACLALVTGCTSFNRDWTAAKNAPPSSDPIAGRWEGMWMSDVNSHADKLRCLLTPISEGKYEARFHAKYRKILSFGYTATFEGIRTNGVFLFSGEADLGTLAGGVYHYKGAVSPTNFFSTYRSKYDNGIFQLSRPIQ